MSNTYTFDGRQCWIACDVGTELGYADNGHEFVAQLRRKWATEIIQGGDVRTLSKYDLQRFREQNPSAPHSTAPRLVVLFEAGLRLAVAHSRKPSAAILRRALIDQPMKPEKQEKPVPSTAMTLFDHTFETAKITTIVYKGRPCWLAREVGEAIGYANNGKDFVAQFTGEWREEMVAGHDFAPIDGEELEQFKALGYVGVESTPSRTPTVTLLFESGLWLALAKTRKPAGKRLRRFLVEQVLPQVARDGRYLPEREVTPQGVMVESEHARKMRELDIEEQKVQAQLRHLDMREREVKAQALVTLVDSLPYLSEDIRQAYRVKAAEELTGRDLAGLLPAAPAGPSWESPTAIGTRMGVSANTVGKAITALGLRGAEGKSRKIVNKAKGHDRTVETWLYSPEAVAEIETYLTQWRR